MNELTVEQKAAVLLIMLGEDVSKQIMQHLPKRDIARIAREVADLGSVQQQDANAVLQQFYTRALNAPSAYGSPDVARRMLSQASISEELVDQLVHDQPTSSDDVLGPVLEANPEVLAKALEEEHPQTTALVLLQLPPKRASQLLAALPSAQRGETVLRMATVAEVPDEILDDIAVSLNERMGSADSSSADGGGIIKTADVLSALPRALAKELLEELEPEHPDHVQQLRDNLYTFESLAAVNARGMQELLRMLDSSVIAVALNEAHPYLVKKFFDNLSERAAQRIQEEIEMNENTSEAEREESRKEILQAALQLEADGKLEFSEEIPDDV